MSDTLHLHRLRMAELERCLRFLGEETGKKELLEVGAGTGFQAKHLAAAGYSVKAIDVDSSAYRLERVYPVLDYDGITIPFPDQRFDIVFSSNVLEHVQDIDGFLRETRRVLKDGGAAVHVVPTAAWHLWSHLTYLPWGLKRGVEKAFGVPSSHVRSSSHPAARARRRSLAEMLGLLFAPRHGERGNRFSEICYYRRSYWLRQFASAGFSLELTAPAGPFYTNSSLFGARLSMPFRDRIAQIFGSACRIYVLRKSDLPEVTGDVRSVHRPRPT